MALREFLRSGKARWLVPVGVVTVLAAAVGVDSSVAGAAPALAPRTPAELLASVAHAAEQPLSGTVVETAQLGFPALPGAGSTSLSWQSLITGSHTARVWYGSPGQVRVSLIGDLAESDMIRNGHDVWIWSSRDNTVSHTVLPAATAQPPEITPPIDPRTAAAQALAALGPTTSVTVDGTSEVAGRPVYELVLAPRSGSSLIGQVRLAIDSQTSVPLRVQVLAKGASDPAFETGFTSVAFGRPAASVFSFSPPAAAKVTESTLPGQRSGSDAAAAGQQPSSATGPWVTGTGWTAVVELSGATALATGAPGSTSGGKESSATAFAAMLRATTPVTGSYGTGQLLQTPLLSALLLPDGRVFVGAVTPDLLEQVASASSK
jgi:outer membrane lipoprotein-sorting protein